jgi:hypothetical protein
VRIPVTAPKTRKLKMMALFPETPILRRSKTNPKMTIPYIAERIRSVNTIINAHLFEYGRVFFKEKQRRQLPEAVPEEG